MFQAEHNPHLIKMEAKTAPLPFWMPQATGKQAGKKAYSHLTVIENGIASMQLKSREHKIQRIRWGAS